jgi:hypothetical protein
MLLTLKNHVFEGNLLLSTLNPDSDSQSDSTSISRSIQPVRKRNTSRNVSKHVSKTSSNRKHHPRKKFAVTHKSATNNTFKIPHEDNLMESQFDRITGASTSVVVGEVEANNSITSDIREMNQKQPERSRLFALNSPSTMSCTSNRRISEDQQKLISTVFSSIAKRKSVSDDESFKEKEKTDIDLEENVPRSPPSRLVAKRARVVFQKCFQTTFDPHMLSGHDVILAEDSEEDNSD